MNERNFRSFLLQKTKANGSRLIFQKKDGWSWKQITWPDLMTEVESIACFLANSGFSKGSRVVVTSPATLSCLFFELAVFTLGGICLPARNMKEAGKILKSSPGNCFFLSAEAGCTQELAKDPAIEKKVEKIFLSTDEKIPVGEKTVSYPNVVKFGFLARKRLMDEVSAAADSVSGDSQAAIFNAGSDSAESRSFSQKELLGLLSLAERELGEFSTEDQAFSYLPGHGSFSRFANLLGLQTTVRGAVAESGRDFFSDVLEIMPVMVFLSGGGAENAVARLREENGPGKNLKKGLGGRARLVLTDVLPSEKTRSLLLEENISVVRLESLSAVP